MNHKPPIIEMTFDDYEVGVKNVIEAKGQRPIYRDRLNIDIEQVRGEIEERIAQLRENTALLPRAIPALTD